MSAPAPRENSAIRVWNALTRDPRFDVSAVPVRVEAFGNNVAIDGWVDSLRDKRRVIQSAVDIVGAERVVDRLLVGPPSTRADSEIAEVVCDTFTEDRAIDETSIDVGVHDGVVSLTGLVDTTMHKKYLGALCWWIIGVRDVHNMAQPIYSEPESDELLIEAIRTVFDKDPLVDTTEILVISHDGIVSLFGSVFGDVAKQSAEDDAWIVEGVRDVVNQIEVTR